MAKRMPSRATSKKPKRALAKWYKSLFCKRSIIIISDHKTQHIPFAATTQLVMMAGTLAFVGWASFSSGSYMAAEKVLAEKDRKLATTTQENERVSAEFGLLKVDLMKLAGDSKSAKSSDVAKIIADHYAADGTVTPAGATETAEDKYSAVFKRIDFLENKVKELQSNHDALLADIRTTTGGKIKELEHVIARTGVAEQPLERAADAKRAQDEQHREKYGRIEGNTAPLGAAAPAGAISNGQGGPYEPMPKSVLKDKETELYFDLRRMMSLNDIVTAMPLDAPIKSADYRQTSGFGARIDPFRGQIGFHSGVDLAGPTGTRVVATNDGRVEFAGWKTAYGNVVDIKHEYGFATRYAHLSRVLVQPDQIVKKGQLIGIEGSTGRSTGEHVHYEVHYNGVAINPGNFLKAGEDVRAYD